MINSSDRPLDMRRPMRRIYIYIYIYIYEKMKYFFGYAPRLCAITFGIQNEPAFGFRRKERKKVRKKERKKKRPIEAGGRKYAPRDYAPGIKGPRPHKRPCP